MILCPLCGKVSGWTGRLSEVLPRDMCACGGVEGLKKELDRLREALLNIQRHGCENGLCMNSAPVALTMRRIAREALDHIVDANKKDANNAAEKGMTKRLEDEILYDAYASLVDNAKTLG